MMASSKFKMRLVGSRVGDGVAAEKRKGRCHDVGNEQRFCRSGGKLLAEGHEGGNAQCQGEGPGDDVGSADGEG